MPTLCCSPCFRAPPDLIPGIHCARGAQLLVSNDRVISDGSGALDAELGHFQAAGQIISQVYQRIAFEATRGASRAAIAAMKNHRGYRTRPSTMPVQSRTAP